MDILGSLKKTLSRRVPKRKTVVRPPATCLGFGAASVAGPVRADNQDRVAVGEVGGHGLCAMADGLGGPLHGAEAADAAVRHAYAELARELPRVLPASAEGVRTLLLSLVWSAANALACAAAAAGRTGPDAGFRTTLILVVALPDCYVAVWIGDGGVFVQRRDGELLAMLEPHKDPAFPSILDASIGPVTDGRPSWCIAQRRPGDLLLVATDGIADTLDRATAARIQAVVEAAAGAAEAARSAVEEFAAARDLASGEFLYADNLTLALLVTAP